MDRNSRDVGEGSKPDNIIRLRDDGILRLVHRSCTRSSERRPGRDRGRRSTTMNSVRTLYPHTYQRYSASRKQGRDRKHTAGLLNCIFLSSPTRTVPLVSKTDRVLSTLVPGETLGAPLCLFARSAASSRNSACRFVLPRRASSRTVSGIALARDDCIDTVSASAGGFVILLGSFPLLRRGEGLLAGGVLTLASKSASTRRVAEIVEAIESKMV